MRRGVTAGPATTLGQVHINPHPNLMSRDVSERLLVMAGNDQVRGQQDCSEDNEGPERDHGTFCSERQGTFALGSEGQPEARCAG